MALFKGHSKASGTHGVPDREPGALKWHIKNTARAAGAPTEDYFVQHLGGRRPLGIIPIREDSMCSWGSIDYDEYDTDIYALMDKVEVAKFPLVPVRSKSNGAHLFLFLSEPEEAAAVQSVLRDAAANLGVAGCEIFPKQTHLIETHDRRDVGSWIIIPYFGGTYDGKLAYQHCIKPSGTDMSLGEFLTYAESKRTTTLEFAKLLDKKLGALVPKDTKKRVKGKSPCDFSDGPPCLQHLAGNGASPVDGRKRILFMISTYLKKADPDGWQEKLERYNQRFTPPLPSSEVDGIIKSASKKSYEYTCRDEPFRSHCNSILCRTRTHGVGTNGAFPVFEVRKIDIVDDPVWLVDIAGKTLDLTTRELQSYALFHAACMHKINKGFMFVDQKTWFATLGEALERMEKPIEPPPDVGRPAEFKELLNEYLTNKSTARQRNGLLDNKPWSGENDNRHYFTLRGLIRHLEQEGMKGLSRIKIAKMIRELGGESHIFNFDNARSKTCWWVPSDILQMPLLIKPERPEGEEV
jgi:hypothetical protein